MPVWLVVSVLGYRLTGWEVFVYMLSLALLLLFALPIILLVASIFTG